MTASIRIDDGTNPPAPSTDNPNSFIGVAHSISNFDDSGVLGWRWTLVDKPAGSSATLTSTSAATTGLTPDVEGTYLVRLETYTDAARTDLDDVDEQVIGVRFVEPLDWLVPAAGETTQQNATRGWAAARNEAIRLTRQSLLPRPGAVVTSGPHTATVTELVLYDPSGGTFTINAPANPVLGDRWAVKNTTTDTTSVTINGNGNNIEDPGAGAIVASYGLATALVSLDYLYDGTNWILQ